MSAARLPRLGSRCRRRVGPGTPLSPPQRPFPARKILRNQERADAGNNHLLPAASRRICRDPAGSGGIRRDAPGSGWIDRQAGRRNYGRINLEKAGAISFRLVPARAQCHRLACPAARLPGQCGSAGLSRHAHMVEEGLIQPD
ncbi:hypothetical protein TMO_a0149 (plasmid) [Tistrella mobilis KA081020-065]|uniref:Uncharacterized protein n=1 Tax=Tistrella mobilis (strain KA081020-065) TaxID=1110502 RepID=I3TS14_TISMK|nr:hypothetical protein TMO_a0149 [Tistrella mobilis KA081020-065]